MRYTIEACNKEQAFVQGSHLLGTKTPSFEFFVAVALAVGSTMIGCDSKKATTTFTSIFKTVRVPSQYGTIQEAVDRADGGDTILVADGVYTGVGNRDIIIVGKVLVIRSENGAEHTIISCGGSADGPRGGFVFEQAGHKGSVIDGFTIRGAYSNEGAGIRLSSSSPRISNCIFDNNHATVSGGAIKVKSSSPIVRNCTFVNNSCASGAIVFGLAGSKPEFEKCIFAFNSDSEPMVSTETTSRFSLECCDVYGNSHGDFVGDIASMAATQSNFSADPLFCDPKQAFALQSDSPCAPGSAACGELVGAVSVGCDEPPK